MSVEFDTSELADLAGDLAAAGQKVTRVSSAKLTEIAAAMRDAAQAAAPVDTQELRNSIKVRGGQDFRIVLADARHAFFVEFGTSDTPPQPYLWPQVPGAAAALIAAHIDAGADIF